MRKQSESWVVKLLGQTFRFATREEYLGMHKMYSVGRYGNAGKIVEFIGKVKELRAKGQLYIEE